MDASKGKLHVDVGFWGGLVPGNEKHLIPLLEHGVVGFKCFLCPSGDETYPHVEKHHVDLAYKELKDSDALIAVCIQSKADWHETQFQISYFSFTRKCAMAPHQMPKILVT